MNYSVYTAAMSRSQQSTVMSVISRRIQSSCSKHVKVIRGHVDAKYKASTDNY